MPYFPVIVLRSVNPILLLLPHQFRPTTQLFPSSQFIQPSMIFTISLYSYLQTTPTILLQLPQSINFAKLIR